MAQISVSEPDKTLFKVGYPSFELITLEGNLANYYSISNGYLDDVSIRLDEGEYSNIKGGLGIFGASNYNKTTYTFDEDYVLSFGYRRVNY